MAKAGILHDYDLMANREESAKSQKCAICGTEPMSFQWSDYSGEAMCCNCGCPYQLKWGSDEQVKENKYPYLNLNDEFLAVAQEYWKEKGKFTCYGWMLGAAPGMDACIAWLKEHYPQFVEENP